MRIVRFDVPAGNAVATLREAAIQADVDIIFAGHSMQGVRTSPLKGEYLPEEAFSLMLMHTPFAVFQHEKSGVFTIRKTATADQAYGDPLPPNSAPMNKKKKPISGFIKGLLAIVVTNSPSASAQDDSSGDATVYELSPFTVQASEDSGYRATSTLAGTRIKTDLKDLGSAISVITSDFMDDTAATDAETLLSYTTNTEVGGAQGNFSGAQALEGARFYQNESRTNPQFNQRIRGLGSAALTRGYFLSEIPFDSYNTDRVSISRGPNSLLFGIGDPGGVINNSTKMPIMGNDFTELEFRMDSNGSMRSVIDVNRSIIDGRAAIRLAGLYDDEKFRQEPAWNRDKRLYLAADVVLAKNEESSVLGETLLRLNGEVGESRGSPPEIIPPSIAYSNWFQPLPVSTEQYTGVRPPPMVLAPEDGGTWEFQETYNPFLVTTEEGINTNTHPSVFRHIVGFYADPNSAEPGLGVGNIDGFLGLIPWNGNRDTLESVGIAGTPGVAGMDPSAPAPRYVHYHANSPYGEGYTIGFAVPTIQNREVFDYRNNVYSGGIDMASREFEAKNIALEQTFFDRKLGIEIAYDSQRYESTQDFYFTGGGAKSSSGPYDIYVEIAEFLPNGEPNPNLGRAYTRARPAVQTDETERETIRFTGFGELDFSESDSWTRHLGRHTFTGLYNEHQKDTHSWTHVEAWASDSFDLASAVAGDTLDHFRRPVNISVFTSDSLLGLSSMDDVRLKQMNLPRPQPGDTYDVLYGISGQSLDVGTVENVRFLDGEGISQQQIDSYALSWQSYFFDRHLVGLLGWRHDDTTAFGRADEDEVGFENRLPSGEWDPTFTRLSEEPSLDESGETVTWSVVARYPEALLGELPGDMDLQFHYAGSENFNPVGLRNDTLGRSLPQPSGETKEYGFLVSFAENKYTLRANWFETSLLKVSAPGAVNVAGFASGRINNYLAAELEGVPFSNAHVLLENPETHPIQSYGEYYDAMTNAIPDILRSVVNPRFEDENGDGVVDDFTYDAVQSLRATTDREAEGFEVEATANLTTNWRALINISRQETMQSNTAPINAAAAEAFNQALEGSGLSSLAFDLSGAGQVRPLKDFWTQTGLAPIRATRALDGTVSNEQREWRFAGVTSYSFNEGFLDGFTFGGAARWQDEAATGYVYVVEEETGVPVPDVNRPFFDDGLFSADVFFSYERPLFEAVEWKIQLNIRNAFGDDDDIPVKTNPDGQIAVIRSPNPTVFYLTNSFRF